MLRLPCPHLPVGKIRPKASKKFPRERPFPGGEKKAKETHSGLRIFHLMKDVINSTNQRPKTVILSKRNRAPALAV